MHKCPAPDCPTLVPSEMFACKPHWFKIPKELRDRIYREYRRGPLSPAHIEAMSQAELALSIT